MIYNCYSEIYFVKPTIVLRYKDHSFTKKMFIKSNVILNFLSTIKP